MLFCFKTKKFEGFIGLQIMIANVSLNDLFQLVGNFEKWPLDIPLKGRDKNTVIASETHASI